MRAALNAWSAGVNALGLRAPLNVDISAGGVGVTADKTRKMQFHPLENESSVGERHAELLKDIVRRQHWRGRACRVSMPMDGVRAHAMTLPLMRRRELNKVMAQVHFWRETMGLTSDDFLPQWSATRTSGGYKVFMFAAVLAEVEAYIACARQSGLQPCALTVVLPCWTSQPDNSVLLWLDPAAPLLVSTVGGQAVLERLTRAPMQEPDAFALDFNRIASAVTENAVVQIVCADKRADAITRLRQQISSPTVLTPFEYFKLPAIRCAMPSECFAIARAMTASKTSLFARRRIPSWCATFVLTSDDVLVRRICVVVMVALPVVVGLLHLTLHDYTERIAAMEQVQAMLVETPRKLAEDAAELNRVLRQRIEESERLDHFARRHRFGTMLLEVLNEIVPPNVHLRRFEFDIHSKAGAPEVKLTGAASSVGAALTLAERLSAMPELAEVNLLEVRRTRDKELRETGIGFQFSIECFMHKSE